MVAAAAASSGSHHSGGMVGAAAAARAREAGFTRKGAVRSALRNHVFQFLRPLEHRNLPGTYRDGLAGARVAGDARLAILYPKGAEPADLDVVTVGERARDRVQERVDGLGHVFLGEARALRDLIHDIRFGHLHLLLGLVGPCAGWAQRPVTS